MLNYFEKLAALGHKLPDGGDVTQKSSGTVRDSCNGVRKQINEITLNLVKEKLMDEYKRREGVKDTREFPRN